MNNILYVSHTHFSLMQLHLAPMITHFMLSLAVLVLIIHKIVFTFSFLLSIFCCCSFYLPLSISKTEKNIQANFLQEKKHKNVDEPFMNNLVFFSFLALQRKSGTHTLGAVYHVHPL